MADTMRSSLPRPDFIELPVNDLPTAQAFYEAAFGWDLTGFGPSYACTLTGDVDVGLQADPLERTAAPLPVIQVADLDAACAAVEAAGGTITHPIFAFPVDSVSTSAIPAATNWPRIGRSRTDENAKERLGMGDFKRDRRAVRRSE